MGVQRLGVDPYSTYSLKQGPAGEWRFRRLACKSHTAHIAHIAGARRLWGFSGLARPGGAPGVPSLNMSTRHVGAIRLRFRAGVEASMPGRWRGRKRQLSL